MKTKQKKFYFILLLENHTKDNRWKISGHTSLRTLPLLNTNAHFIMLPELSWGLFFHSLSTTVLYLGKNLRGRTFEQKHEISEVQFYSK